MHNDYGESNVLLRYVYMPMHRELNQDFFKTWTPEMAYVLGFFAADGSMLKNSRGGHFIEFTIVDRIVLEHIRRVTGSNHRISARKRLDGAKTAYRLQIGSKEWFEDLSCIGFTQNKSKSLQFPKIPKKYFGDFVRGYFDGDGCVYFKKHFVHERQKERWVFTTRFTCGSRPYLEYLHGALLKVGLKKGFIVVKSNGSGFELIFSHHDSVALCRLMYHTGEASSLCLPRKREKLERAVKILKLDKLLRL